MKSKIERIVIAIIFASVSICAQQNVSTSGWDLTYKSVLERNNVDKSEWIWRWLGEYKSPAEKWIANWEGKPIVSSILIEYPAFHAAEHTTMWLIRTNDEAFYCESSEGLETYDNEEPISLQIYDAIYKQASSWQQLPPKTAKELPDQALPGYFGFLSYVSPTRSKQMLLTVEDFICLEKSCLPGNGKLGRLMEALEPILIPDAEKNYRHKSEAEIARMTPEQRIDEQIIEDEYHDSDSKDRQSDLIKKYRRTDGLAGLPYLIQLIDGYNPKARHSRSSNAVMMATDIDENVVRLRASPEGRSVIEAIERMSAKMAAAGKNHTYAEMDLPHLKGINFTDQHVRDTLWVKYRIKISDSELLEFSNYLVKNDPTYPNWSKTDFIKDYSRINEAGSPAQVYVMKKPKRYYRAYLSFKRHIQSAH